MSFPTEGPLPRLSLVIWPQYIFWDLPAMIPFFFICQIRSLNLRINPQKGYRKSKNVLSFETLNVHCWVVLSWALNKRTPFPDFLSILLPSGFWNSLNYSFFLLLWIPGIFAYFAYLFYFHTTSLKLCIVPAQEYFSILVKCISLFQFTRRTCNYTKNPVSRIGIFFFLC